MKSNYSSLKKVVMNIYAKRVGQKATSQKETNVFPHESSAQIHQKTPNYSKMQSAISKIAHPVTFESLRQFYGLKANSTEPKYSSKN